MLLPAAGREGACPKSRKDGSGGVGEAGHLSANTCKAPARHPCLHQSASVQLCRAGPLYRRQNRTQPGFFLRCNPRTRIFGSLCPVLPLKACGRVAGTDRDLLSALRPGPRLMRGPCIPANTKKGAIPNSSFTCFWDSPSTSFRSSRRRAPSRLPCGHAAMRRCTRFIHDVPWAS